MINNLIFMNGYGLYVWSAFIFTFFCFISLYLITRKQYLRENKKFIAKFGNLNSERAALARNQKINKEILSNISNI